MYSVCAASVIFINPQRMRSEGYSTWLVCLCVPVCLLPRFLPPRTIKQPKSAASVLYRQHFNNGDFRKSTAFKKLWREKANMLMSTASPRHRSFLHYNKGTSKLCIGFSPL